MNSIATRPPVSAIKRSTEPVRPRMRLKRTLTIQWDAAELFSLWLEAIGPQESPSDGAPVPSEAVITKAIPGQLISWTIPDIANGPHTGIVRFETAAGNLGTEVTVVLEYSPASGGVAVAINKFSNPDAAERMVRALSTLKSVLETEQLAPVSAMVEKAVQPRSAPLLTGLKKRLVRIEAPLSIIMEDVLPQWMRSAPAEA
jgi:hypothetical protein